MRGEVVVVVVVVLGLVLVGCGYMHARADKRSTFVLLYLVAFCVAVSSAVDNQSKQYHSIQTDARERRRLWKRTTRHATLLSLDLITGARLDYKRKVFHIVLSSYIAKPQNDFGQVGRRRRRRAVTPA